MVVNDGRMFQGASVPLFVGRAWPVHLTQPPPTPGVDNVI